MSKNIYSFFNKTSGELPQAEPLNETEVNRYMKEFRNRTKAVLSATTIFQAPWSRLQVPLL